MGDKQVSFFEGAPECVPDGIQYPLTQLTWADEAEDAPIVPQFPVVEDEVVVMGEKAAAAAEDDSDGASEPPATEKRRKKMPGSGLQLWHQACRECGYLSKDKGVKNKPIPKKGTAAYAELRAHYQALLGRQKREFSA